MKCALMQPTYLPWLGYFDLIRNVDCFVIYDHVQFEKQSWQQRNRIRNKEGDLMLTMAVLHEKGLERRIKDVKIDYSRKFPIKHLNSLNHSYARSKNFNEIFPEIEAIFKKENEFLIDLNLDLIKLGMKHLSITKEFIFSSDLDVQGQKVEGIIDVCKKLNATEYLSPVGSKAYIDENNIFAANDIELSYQDFAHPVYKQINFQDFISHLSFIDYLFNVDLNETKQFGALKTQSANA
jgi:hypothetical protein